MSAMKFCAPTLLVLAMCVPANAQAAFENTYHVEVRLEHWNIGYSFWSSEYTTTSHHEAQLMHDLLVIALESEVIHSTLDIDEDFLVTDVRIRTEYPEQLIQPVGQPRIRPWFGWGGVFGSVTPEYGKK